MLQTIALIFLLSPLVFQYIYGTKVIYNKTSMRFAKISLISFTSQILFSVGTFAVASYNFSKYFDEHPNQTRCGTPLAGLLVTLIFLIVVLIVFILLQFLMIMWKKNREKMMEND